MRVSKLLEPAVMANVLVDTDQAKSYLNSPAIKICVGSGDDQRNFAVHRDLLTARSKFFANALNGNWVESDDNMVKLCDHDPTIFATYIQLLYSNVLPIMKELDLGSTKDVEFRQTKISEAVSEEWYIFSELYILCDMLQDTQSKNLIITAIVQAFFTRREGGKCWGPDGYEISRIYDATTKLFPVRRLLVDLQVNYGTASYILDHPLGDFFNEFLYDIAGALLKHRENGNNRGYGTEDIVATKYHEALDGGDVGANNGL